MKFKKGIYTFLLFLAVLLWIAVFDTSREDYLEVNFFDVGQGDSIFIETPQGHQILIDGGPGISVLEKLGREMPFWDRTIDLIVLTHPEHDHLVGLLEVLNSYQVENILWTGVLRDTAEFYEWQRLIGEEEADVLIALAGQRIIWGKEDEYFEVLFPFDSLEGNRVDGANNTSAVIKLVSGETEFLFTGDINKSVEKELVKRGTDISADVLKVGHHGSKTSSAAEFIESVLPQLAVIQCGKDNSYGHPYSGTLEILENYGINIFRTDLQGDLKLIVKDDKLYGVSDF